MISSDLVDLKRERWLAEPNNPHFAKKVNTVVQKSTLYFQVSELVNQVKDLSHTHKHAVSLTLTHTLSLSTL